MEMVRLPSLSRVTSPVASTSEPTQFGREQQIGILLAVDTNLEPLMGLANLIKASSVLSVIAVLEMTKIANSIRAATFKSTEIYILVAILYFVVIQFIIWGAGYLEQNVFNYQRSRKRVARQAPAQA